MLLLKPLSTAIFYLEASTLVSSWTNLVGWSQFRKLLYSLIGTQHQTKTSVCKAVRQTWKKPENIQHYSYAVKIDLLIQP